MRLTQEELQGYIASNPLEPGTSKRLNHKGCATTKHSKSLQLWRKEDGSYNAYCFKCSSSGGVFSSPLEKRLLRREESSNHFDLRRVPRDATPSRRSNYNYERLKDRRRERVIAKWPRWAREWILQYIDSSDLKAYGFYIPSVDCIAFPTMTIAGDETGLVLRPNPSLELPKYVNAQSEVQGVYGIAQQRKHGNAMDHCCVVVEDCVSAIKCSKHMYALAMLGSKLLDEHIKVLSSPHFDRIILYLDNDNPTVRKNRRKAKSTLDLMGKRVVTVKLEVDPKSLNKVALLETLYEAACRP